MPGVITGKAGKGLAVVAIAGSLAAAALSGCGSDEGSATTPRHIAHPRANPHPSPVGSRPATPRLPAKLVAAHCLPGAANCRSAEGSIAYIEAVDPDGDGDAHFVLLSSESVTLPGITVIDVEKAMRPHPLPHLGDRVSAAGPVYTGSHGQRQIQATELHLASG